MIDEIAGGFDRFTTSSDDIEVMVWNWGGASGAYQRVAEQLWEQPPPGVPSSISQALADALDEAAQALLDAGHCVAQGIEDGDGPEVCKAAFSTTEEANAEIAVRLNSLVPYGSRSPSEVLALFS